MARPTTKDVNNNATKAGITEVARNNREMKVAQNNETHDNVRQRSRLQQAQVFSDHKWSSKELVSINCEDVPEIVNVDVG